MSDISDKILNRRNFLKAAGLAAAGLGLAGCNEKEPENTIKYPIEISPGLERIADMDHEHWDAGVLFHKKEIHVFGGSSQHSWCWPIAKYSTLNPDTLIWTPRKDMPEALARMASFVFEGNIMTVGGKMYDKMGHKSGPKVDYVFHYDAGHNKWEIHEPFPFGISSAEGVMVDGIPHVLGGHIGNVGMNLDIFKYNKAKDSWDVKTRIPTPVYRISTTTAKDGKIYIFGPAILDKKKGTGEYIVQIYDSRNDKWDKKDMPEGYDYMYSFVKNDNVNLWACKGNYYSDGDVLKNVLYSSIEEGKWDKADLPMIFTSMASCTEKTVVDDHLYLVGATGINIGRKGKVHRFKLPQKTT